MSGVPYPLLCTLLGLLLAWGPWLVHGPIPQKFDLFYLKGSVVVWAWYAARMSIGFWVGITAWPARWWVRGPLCGVLAMLPLGFVSLGTPTCGAPCVAVNTFSGALIGLLVAGGAQALGGERRAPTSR
jgi:hypothetical protein